MRLTATEVLRRHVTERHLRTGIRSVDLAADQFLAAPRLGEAAWVESCLAVRGVPEPTLDVLGLYYTGHRGWTVKQVPILIQGRFHEMGWGRVPIPIKLWEAASRVLGRDVDAIEARALHCEAIRIVVDNAIAHARVEQEAA